MIIIIYEKQPKKIKGIRKKLRDEAIERLTHLHPIWFEGKSEREIRDVVNAFRNTYQDDSTFPSFCMKYETEQEQLRRNKNGK